MKKTEDNMKVSERLKKAAEAAKKDGKEFLAVVCSNHYHTTYYHVVKIQDILDAELGTSFSYGRYHGQTRASLPEKTVRGYLKFLKIYG